jgi:predicted acetyltransferase
MQTLKLILPSLEIKSEIAKFLQELKDGENGYRGSDFASGLITIEQQIENYQNMHLGKNLESWQVPQTTFLLVDKDNQIVGMSRLRHTLNENLLHHGGHIGYFISQAYRGKGYGAKILDLTLQEAKKLNINQILITVQSYNSASIRVIEKNGGILEDERLDEDGNPFKRYWINL